MVMGINGIVANSGAEDSTLLDVRSFEEFSGIGGAKCCRRKGRLPDSVHIEWTEFRAPATGRFQSPKAIRKILDKADVNTDHEIVTYCHRGARSSFAYSALKHAGCRQVKNYIGSWHEWAARNDVPVETGC